MRAAAYLKATKAVVTLLYADVRSAGARIDLMFVVAWLALMVLSLTQHEWTFASLEFCLALTYLRVVGLTVLVDLYRSFGEEVSR